MFQTVCHPLFVTSRSASVSASISMLTRFPVVDSVTYRENAVPLRDYTSAMHLHCQSVLVGACLPQTLPATNWNLSLTHTNFCRKCNDSIASNLYYLGFVLFLFYMDMHCTITLNRFPLHNIKIKATCRVVL